MKCYRLGESMGAIVTVKANSSRTIDAISLSTVTFQIRPVAFTKLGYFRPTAFDRDH